MKIFRAFSHKIITPGCFLKLFDLNLMCAFLKVELKIEAGKKHGLIQRVGFLKR